MKDCRSGLAAWAILVFGALLVAGCCGGCGTVLSLRNVDREGELHGLVYGGVRLDYHLAFDEDFLGHALFLKPLFAFDIPLSLAGDTLALPYTAIKRRYAVPEPPRSASQRP